MKNFKNLFVLALIMGLATVSYGQSAKKLKTIGKLGGKIPQSLIMGTEKRGK